MAGDRWEEERAGNSRLQGSEAVSREVEGGQGKGDNDSLRLQKGGWGKLNEE